MNAIECLQFLFYFIEKERKKEKINRRGLDLSAEFFVTQGYSVYRSCSSRSDTVAEYECWDFVVHIGI